MLSMPLDDARRSEPAKGAVAEGDGTFLSFDGGGKRQHDKSWKQMKSEKKKLLGSAVKPSIIYHFGKSCEEDKSERKFP